MILAADIGGTNSRFAVFELRAGRLAKVWQETFRSAEHAGVTELARAAREACQRKITAATFGVAGPVRHGRSQTTNLPWVVDAQDLARALGLRTAGLINDLAANAYGLSELSPADLVTLHAGEPGAEGNQALISAGTGLGEAGLYWDGRHHQPFASEGGHTSFAPGDDRELTLWRWLKARFAHVSWERVVSGPGLVHIHACLRETGQFPQSAAPAEDPAAITAAAASGNDALARSALDLFVTLYGAEAGNLALKVMATGGVFLGGGIAPRILPFLQDGRFLAAFFAKGRLRPVLEAMPVRVVTNDQAALLGAARHAAELS
ncbi:MAG: glucokinase [Planctomycetota bacterium]